MNGIPIKSIHKTNVSQNKNTWPAVAMPNAHDGGFAASHKWGTGYNSVNEVAVGMPNQFNDGMSEGHSWHDSCTCFRGSFLPGEEPLLAAAATSFGI